MPQMELVDERTDVAASARQRVHHWPVAMVLLFLGLLWFEAVRQLKPEWSVNPQYSYGWSVPFLAVYLLARRWATRPRAHPAASRAIANTFILLGAVAVLPIRFLAEANPDWRLLSWGIALVAATLTMLSIYLVGGRSWVRHFGFPVLFFLVAVPWPMQLEQVVTQNLMRAVTLINVALLQLFGIPALQHGNVIEVGSGLIGIEEACSGVRSLQATLMISLFLGELYLFPLGRRILLIITGAALAFVCNVVRTALLVWAGAKNGAHSIEAWHDPAGFTILLVCLFGLWFISVRMRRSSPGDIETGSVTDKDMPLGSFARMAAAVTVVILLSEAVVQIWYRAHEQTSKSRWTVSWPNAEPNYEPVTIAPESAALLQYSSGGGASWQAPDGRRWMMYFCNWLPGRTAAHFVKIHRPDICLPASGLTMERDNGIKLLSVNGVNLPVRSYRFDDHGIPLHVFYCYWDARSNYDNVASAEEEDWTAQGRIRAALRGRREVGAQMLEIIVWNYDDDALANEALQQQLVAIVHNISA
jgi:exosortase